MNFLQLNKFSELHDGSRIIFCKTDFLLEDFRYIESLPHDVVLITGNSDYPITDQHIDIVPKNIKKWFAQNALSNSPLLEPLPLGLENKLPCLRNGHGIGYFERVSEKEQLLSRNGDKKIPLKFIYSNFNINTNFNERIVYKNISLKTPHIDWEDNTLSLKQFFDKILEYKMVLCPIGNGVDTHRLWEVLYSDRIPVIVKTGNYKIYELYKNLPIIILNNLGELGDFDTMTKKYEESFNKVYNKDILLYPYWKNKILKEINYEV